MPEFTPKPGYVFPGVVPREALAFFRAKGWAVGFSHLDVFREEHATAFTVAKAMEADVLVSIRGAVDDALEEGRTFRQFSNELTPKLQKLGWWGEQDRLDPLTGKKRPVLLGSPRRLRTIYRTNLRTARAAGQWDRVQRTSDTLPYLLYELGPSESHRPQHEAWAGTLLPIDDPWWTTHYPPNGWGCKCRVRQVSRREAERRGGVSTRPDHDPVEWTNKRTGEVFTLDRGLDPGWDTNPGAIGRSTQAQRLLEDTSRGPSADPPRRRGCWKIRRLHWGSCSGKRWPESFWPGRCSIRANEAQLAGILILATGAVSKHRLKTFKHRLNF